MTLLLLGRWREKNKKAYVSSEASSYTEINNKWYSKWKIWRRNIIKCYLERWREIPKERHKSVTSGCFWVVIIEGREGVGLGLLILIIGLTEYWHFELCAWVSSIEIGEKQTVKVNSSLSLFGA